jgi:hypothetical protein
MPRTDLCEWEEAGAHSTLVSGEMREKSGRTRDDEDVVAQATTAALLELEVHRLPDLRRRFDDIFVDSVLAVDDDIADRGVLGCLESEVAEVDSVEGGRRREVEGGHSGCRRSREDGGGLERRDETASRSGGRRRRW